MSFFTTRSNEEQREQTFKKKVFLAPEGRHVVRILEGDPIFHITWVHWIRRIAPVECLDDGCPICANNKIIETENPQSFWKIPGYSKRQETFYLNVLDRTPVKKCPDCGHDNVQNNGVWNPVCSNKNCNTLINAVEIAPSNTVKIFSRGTYLMDLIDGFQKTVLDNEGNQVGVTNFDIQLLVTSNNQVVAFELPQNNDDVSGLYSPADLFDLTDAVIKLDADEMLEFYKGASLKDIFANRTVSDEAPENVATGSSKATISDLSPDELKALEERVKQLMQAS